MSEESRPAEQTDDRLICDLDELIGLYRRRLARGATTPDALPRERDAIVLRVHAIAGEVRGRLEGLAH